MNKILDEWIEAYNKKIPEGFKRDENFAFFYLPDKGFCEVATDGTIMIMGQVSGDGRFWRDFAEKLAREFNINVCGTKCARKEFKAWIRLFGFKIDKWDEENGLKRYYGTDKNGCWGIMTEYELDTGDSQYYVTWEVK